MTIINILQVQEPLTEASRKKFTDNQQALNREQVGRLLLSLKKIPLKFEKEYGVNFEIRQISVKESLETPTHLIDFKLINKKSDDEITLSIFGSYHPERKKLGIHIKVNSDNVNTFSVHNNRKHGIHNNIAVEDIGKKIFHIIKGNYLEVNHDNNSRPWDFSPDNLIEKTRLLHLAPSLVPHVKDPQDIHEDAYFNTDLQTVSISASTEPFYDGLNSKYNQRSSYQQVVSSLLRTTHSCESFITKD